MKKFKTTKDFIDRASQRFNNKFDYSITKYQGMHEKLNIICPIHGEFEQIALVHLTAKYGCPKCGLKSMAKAHTITLEETKSKLKTIFPLLSIIEYKGASSRCLVKDENGIIYNTIISRLFRGNYPSIQSALDKNKAFIIRANKVHNNRYDYYRVEYIKQFSSIIIICKTCGDFLQTPNSHLNGNGCPICNKQRGYSKSDFTNYCNSKNITDCSLYIIKCYNESEQFIKIGITTKSIQDRFKFPRDMPYSYEIIKEYKDSPINIYEKEKFFHKSFSKSRYSPNLSFIGKTECFTIDILEEINNY